MISLINTAKYYRGLAHQDAALNWLQSQISSQTLDRFAQMWRAAPQVKEYVSLDDLLKITSVTSRDRLRSFVEPLNVGFERFRVNTPLRICHFLAQVLHESGEFQYQEEIASGADYEGRVDLGNIQPGDGIRYKGRGLIQVTGRYNYERISQDVGIDYVSNPSELAKLPSSVWSAFWFWNFKNLSAFADKDNFDSITYAINGGFNGYSDRLKYLQRAKQVLIQED